MFVSEMVYPEVASTMPEKEPIEPLEFVSIKIDKDVLKIAKAAAALEGKHIQDYLSDVMNVVASKALGRKPIRRKPSSDD